MVVLVWAIAALVLVAARAASRAYGRNVRNRLADERQELSEAEAWFRTVRSTR